MRTKAGHNKNLCSLLQSCSDILGFYAVIQHTITLTRNPFSLHHLSPSFYTFLRFPPCGYFIHICILFPYLYTNSLLFPSPPPLHLSSLPPSRSHWAFLLWFIIPPVSCLRRKVGPVICRMKTTTNCTQFVYCSVDIKTIGRCELYARELKNYGGWGGGGEGLIH